MGHQLNFYATPTDIAQLEAAAARIEPMAILHDRSPTAEPRTLSSLDHQEDGRRHLFYFLVRPEDLSSVVANHIGAQGDRSIDVLRSPVIELNSCFFDGQILRRGRIYWVDGYYGEDGAWIEKPEPFRAWAKRVRAAMRKALTTYESFEYIGSDARAWRDRAGGRLVSQ